MCVCAAVLSRFLRLVPAIDYRHNANPQRKSVPSVIPIMMHSSLEGETSLGVVCVLLLGVCACVGACACVGVYACVVLSCSHYLRRRRAFGRIALHRHLPLELLQPPLHTSILLVQSRDLRGARGEEW